MQNCGMRALRIILAGLASALVALPALGQTWTTTGPMHEARPYVTLTGGLPGSHVLAVGSDGLLGAPSAEVYDPGIKQWTLTTPPATRRVFDTASLLSTGQVLIAGG